MRTRHAGRALALLMGVSLCITACRTVTVNSAQPVAPAMVIERFLRAANENDLDTMASLFGTTEGPVTERWPKKEQDDRMFPLASLLRHSDYSVGSQQIVPGRRDEAVMFNVTLTKGELKPIVPFRLVRHEATWLVENICVERLSQGPSAPCRN